jgi:hypothetical protein
MPVHYNRSPVPARGTIRYLKWEALIKSGLLHTVHGLTTEINFYNFPLHFAAKNCPEPSVRGQIPLKIVCRT